MKTIYQTAAVLALGLMGVGQDVRADDLADLQSLVQRSRTVISSNASIDEFNPESVTFNTYLDSQLVELRLAAGRLNDAFISAINYPQDPAASRSGKFMTWIHEMIRTRDERDATQITFGNLQVLLDGCDITQALINQCNTQACWEGNPQPQPTAFTGVFATAIHLNLSDLNPQTIAGCSLAGQTRFFDATHTQHTIQLRETVTNQGKGGSLQYQVIVFNKNY